MLSLLWQSEACNWYQASQAPIGFHCWFFFALLFRIRVPSPKTADSMNNFCDAGGEFGLS
jgi:hypothetical protein